MLHLLGTVSRALKTVMVELKAALLSLKAMPLTIAKWIGGIVTVASLLVVTFQYLDARWKSRIERSLNLVLIYQGETKVKIRNQIDLRDNPMISINAGCEPYNKTIASKIDFAGDDHVCQANRCMAAIHRFVNARIGSRRKGVYIYNGVTSEIIYNKPGVLTARVLELSDGEGIKTKWGDVAASNGSLQWFERGTAYDYSWPDMIWAFFNSSKDKQECLKFLKQYEESLNNEFLAGLHALEHFYATVAICATSGVCDSFVACEAFYREVGTFVADWQSYFELWGPREGKSEYDRLHDFLKHCASNEEFIRYLRHGKPNVQMLTAQQFTNYCWETDEQGGEFCGLLGWLTEIGAEPSAEVTLRVQHFVEREAPAHARFIEPWARRVEEQSDGRIKVEIYPGMELGGAPEELYRQVREGRVDIVWTLIGYTPGEFPRSEVFELPSVHRGSALATTLAIQDVFDQIAPDYAEVHPLLIHVHAGQVIHMVDKPIRSVGDLAGLKIRTPSHTGQMLIEAWNAIPVSMPLPELPEALSEGKVDGALVPYEIVLPYKIHELTKQSIEGLNGRRFGTSVFAFLMNKERYDGLPDDLKAVIDANSGKAIAGKIGNIWDQAEKPGKDATIASGNKMMDLTPEAMAEFDERSQRVTARWLEYMKANGIPGAEALLSAATAAVERHSRSN